MNDPSNVMDRVRRALGRPTPSQTPPTPPKIDEPVARLVHTDFGLPELWAKRAAEMKVDVELCYPEELAEKLIGYLRAKDLKRIGLSDSKLLSSIELPQALAAAGVDATPWSKLTLDAAYDLDASVTDAAYAVAETGSLVVLPHAGHGRVLSLVPKVHVAILEPKNFLPDLIDFMEKMAADESWSYATMITGPSKTSDIEMKLVTGVHGPYVVKAYVLQ